MILHPPYCAYQAERGRPCDFSRRRALGTPEGIETPDGTETGSNGLATEITEDTEQSKA